MALEDYSFADRAVHKLAVGARVPQDMLCDMEAQMHGSAIAAQAMGAPIFVTSLPRAGTTLLLEVLARHRSLVTHSYRDMPFVLSPVMWRKLSGRFQVKQAAKERAHKDGLLVSVDSPEAFEEVLWLRHFPEHYSERGITPWGDLPEGFTRALRHHMQALIHSRGGEAGEAPRYLSKNNANIARIAGLAKAFPDARFLVPLRDPLAQAKSLLRQHQLALETHAQSAFARRYVRDIGHFEFGADHKPILFEGMEQVIESHDPLTLDYWLAYWIAAYRHLAGEEACELIGMEAFTGSFDPHALWTMLGLPADDAASSDARALVRPIPKVADAAENSALLDEALSLFAQLRAQERRAALTDKRHPVRTGCPFVA